MGTTDEQAARMQKMMMWMPALMGVFLYNYAAGLSLYMITQSTFGILETTVVKKIWPIDDTPSDKPGLMARLMARAPGKLAAPPPTRSRRRIQPRASRRGRLSRTTQSRRCSPRLRGCARRSNDRRAPEPGRQRSS